MKDLTVLPGNQDKPVYMGFLTNYLIFAQKNKMLEAVLFDMDGVIVDTEPLHHKAYRGMFEEQNIEVTDTMYSSFTGQSTLDICKKLCDHFQLTADPQELVLQKRNKFKSIFAEDPYLKLIEGVLDRIQEYYEKGLTLILASSASMGTINAVFERFDLNRYFTAKLSGADLKASKPHPEIFTKAAEAAGASSENCVVIEDSENGIKAAVAAGIPCIGYKSTNSKSQDLSKADKVIEDFKEIRYPELIRWFSENRE